MKFDTNLPIYRQIADYILNTVITKGHFNENGRIPSIRNLSKELEVNPNTTLRAYNHLEALGLISKKRGIGYFLNDEAVDQAKALERWKFVNEEIPRIALQLDVIGMEVKEFSQLLSKQLK